MYIGKKSDLHKILKADLSESLIYTSLFKPERLSKLNRKQQVQFVSSERHLGLFSTPQILTRCLWAFSHQNLAEGSREGLSLRPGLKMSLTSISRRMPGTLKMDTADKERKRKKNEFKP